MKKTYRLLSLNLFFAITPPSLLATEFNETLVCAEIAKDAQIKQCAITVDIINDQKSRIPDNLWRTTFNGLGEEDTQEVILKAHPGLVFTRQDGITAELMTLEHLPDPRAGLSNAAKPLYFADRTTDIIRLDQNKFNISYSYTGSILNMRQTWTVPLTVDVTPDTHLVNRRSALQKRADVVQGDTAFNLDLSNARLIEGYEDLEDRLSGITDKCQGYTIQALERLKVIHSLFQGPTPQLSLSGSDEDDETTVQFSNKSKWVAFAWNTYQLKAMIQDKFKKFMALQAEGAETRKVREHIDELENNINLHFKMAICAFGDYLETGKAKAGYQHIFDDYMRY